jgi:hypothetical protein
LVSAFIGQNLQIDDIVPQHIIKDDENRLDDA